MNGIFAVPDATDPETTVETIVAADRSGLDLVGVQDHPYHRRFFDTWTLLSYVAGRTERVRLVPDVVNLPLRLPSVLAKSAASLDVLSGGRVDLGIGAGAFWDAVEAMGGPRRTPKESVDASIGGHFMDPADTPRMQSAVDEAAGAAGRDPADVERAVNVAGLEGPPEGWADQLAGVVELGFSTLLVSVPDDDPVGSVRRLGEDVAPRLRELVG